MIMSEETFEAQVANLERSIAQTERALAGEGIEAARALVRAVLDVHRTAISDMLAGLHDAGVDCPREVIRRSPVAWLLALHDLTPDSLADRVREALRDALDGAGPSTSAELAGIDGGEVRIRLGGDDREAILRLQRSIERSVNRLAPEASVEFDDPPPESSVTFLLPAERLVRRPAGPPR
jgi:hypothetical protein